MYLFHAAKRSIPKSHDRNKQKRRLREAVKKLPAFEATALSLKESSQQALVLLRTVTRPSKEGSWEAILKDMEVIGQRLLEVVKSA